MRASFLLIVLVGLLLVAAALAPVFRNDPGFVSIQFHDWTIETSVLVLALGLLLTWVLIQLLVWLWRLPAETARKVQERRGLAQLEKGLLALTEGDWKAAERALSRSANMHGKSTARYLAAAQAAHGLEASDKREFYLEQANTGGRRNQFLIDLTRARLLMNSGEARAAEPLLEDLLARRKGHAQVLELLVRCYSELDEWKKLQDLLPALRKSEIMNAEQLLEVQHEIARDQLAGAADVEVLQAAWKSMPRDMRENPTVVEVFARRAGALQRSDLAEEVLRAAIRKQWNPALVLRYGDPGSGNAAVRLKQCEDWLQDHFEDAALHMALGRLCAGQELWGKARHHLIRSLEIEASAPGYDALGQLFERLGELEPAMACFRNALRMTQGRKPEPLPPDLARLGAPARSY